MRVAFPAHGRSSLNREHGNAIRQNLKLVLLGLRVEDLEARSRDHTRGHAVLLLQVVSSLDTDADFGSGRDQSHAGVGHFHGSIGSLDRKLDRRVLQLGQVLTGESKDAGGVLGGQRNVVGSAGLVPIGRTPHHAVRQRTEVSQGFHRLVSRTVLTQANRVVGSNVDHTNARQSRQTDGTRGVRDEVQESTTGGDDSAVDSQTVHDGSHSVLTHTVADVAAGPVANAVLRGLEVDGVLPAGVVGARQVRRAREKLRDDVVDLLQDRLAQLTRGNGRIARLVGGEALLPALRKLARETAGKICVLSLVLRSVLLEELVPLLLLGSTLGGVLVVEVVDLLGHNEGLLGVETEQLLDTLTVIGLEGVTVDTTSTLQLGAESNGGGQLDDCGLVSDLTSLADSSLDTVEVVVTVLDGHAVPAVGLEALDNVLSESTLGVTI